ncbi:hypothetical protein DVH24_026375 [Malus domestica]|uniref:Uncharacterized protein n=1 Tax=Malus domestica TaxID=3750 RepID=A0A498KGD5_MALDO|nr:hypothetical protein DVH24_026375 [Malus domestica]
MVTPFSSTRIHISPTAIIRKRLGCTKLLDASLDALYWALEKVGHKMKHVGLHKEKENSLQILRMLRHIIPI